MRGCHTVAVAGVVGLKAFPNQSTHGSHNVQGEHVPPGKVVHQTEAKGADRITRIPASQAQLLNGEFVELGCEWIRLRFTVPDACVRSSTQLVGMHDNLTQQRKRLPAAVAVASEEPLLHDCFKQPREVEREREHPRDRLLRFRPGLKPIINRTGLNILILDPRRVSHPAPLGAGMQNTFLNHDCWRHFENPTARCYPLCFLLAFLHVLYRIRSPWMARKWLSSGIVSSLPTTLRVLDHTRTRQSVRPEIA